MDAAAWIALVQAIASVVLPVSLFVLVSCREEASRFQLELSAVGLVDNELRVLEQVFSLLKQGAETGKEERLKPMVEAAREMGIGGGSARISAQMLPPRTDPKVVWSLSAAIRLADIAIARAARARSDISYQETLNPFVDTVEYSERGIQRIAEVRLWVEQTKLSTRDMLTTYGVLKYRSLFYSRPISRMLSLLSG